MSVTSQGPVRPLDSKRKGAMLEVNVSEPEPPLRTQQSPPQTPKEQQMDFYDDYYAGDEYSMVAASPVILQSPQSGLGKPTLRVLGNQSPMTRPTLVTIGKDGTDEPQKDESPIIAAAKAKLRKTPPKSAAASLEQPRQRTPKKVNLSETKPQTDKARVPGVAGKAEGTVKRAASTKAIEDMEQEFADMVADLGEPSSPTKPLPAQPPLPAVPAVKAVNEDDEFEDAEETSELAEVARQSREFKKDLDLGSPQTKVPSRPKDDSSRSAPSTNATKPKDVVTVKPKSDSPAKSDAAPKVKSNVAKSIKEAEEKRAQLKAQADALKNLESKQEAPRNEAETTEHTPSDSEEEVKRALSRARADAIKKAESRRAELKKREDAINEAATEEVKPKTESGAPKEPTTKNITPQPSAVPKLEVSPTEITKTGSLPQVKQKARSEVAKKIGTANEEAKTKTAPSAATESKPFSPLSKDSGTVVGNLRTSPKKSSISPIVMGSAGPAPANTSPKKTAISPLQVGKNTSPKKAESIPQKDRENARSAEPKSTRPREIQERKPPIHVKPESEINIDNTKSSPKKSKVSNMVESFGGGSLPTIKVTEEAPKAKPTVAKSKSAAASASQTKVTGPSLNSDVPESDLIVGVCVVGFHHTRGPEVEYWVGPEGNQSHLWPYLPFQSLPDGSHSFEESICYFTLLYDPTTHTAPNPTPERDEEGHIIDKSDFNKVETLFGTSCTRQMMASELKNKPDDVTRSTVQKSIVVLARKPVFGPIKEKLKVVTRTYFSQKDFEDRQIIDSLYDNLVHMFIQQKGENNLLNGTNVRELVHNFGIQVLVLFKALLLEKRIMFYASDTETLCSTQISLISLIPNLLDHLEDCGSPLLSTYETHLSKPTFLRTSDRESLLRFLGLPLQVFAAGGMFTPFIPLQLIDELKQPEMQYGMFGSTNRVFLSQGVQYDILVDVDNFKVTIENPELKSALQLTNADKAFFEPLEKAVNSSRDSGNTWQSISLSYVGSDDFVWHNFEDYIMGLLSSAKYDNYCNGHPRNNSFVRDYPTNPLKQFNPNWTKLWKHTNNYRIFNKFTDEELFDIVEPSHIGLLKNRRRTDAIAEVRGMVDHNRNADSNLPEQTEGFSGKILNFFGWKSSPPSTPPLVPAKDPEYAHKVPPPISKSIDSPVIVDKDQTQESHSEPTPNNAHGSPTKSGFFFWSK